ncbi:hypothetical protein KUTeg_006805 [Tegillarca granosa]|uniref:exodeoxyribonuclease III n=1 Tax=Tegillarca granosa TaxID=220873 RepID=A0ABQ9FG47_TEGGR|nr:hypothetical protein KUTeg_006805 [Tegillarca granosa]
MAILASFVRFTRNNSVPRSSLIRFLSAKSNMGKRKAKVTGAEEPTEKKEKKPKAKKEASVPEVPEGVDVSFPKEIPKEANVSGYHTYWYSAEQEGYAGTGLYSKTKPINVTKGIDVPNSGRGLPRLPYRSKEWDVDFTAYLKKLDAKKPVIMCGDLNVAHLEIDLKNPKTNKKTAGFTAEEREGFGNMLKEGFIDSFRELYPEARDCYSFWTYMGNAREKNVGWRLDYFVLSERLKKDLCDSIIQQKYMGSDHCPILLQMAF